MKKDIYIFNNGVLKRKDNSLIFVSSEKTNLIPIEESANIWIFGEVEFNKKVIDFLSQKNIVVHIYNYYGYYSSSIYPRECYNSGFVLLKQAEFYMDNNKRLNIAKNILIAAFKSMRQNLVYYANRKERSFKNHIQYLECTIENIENSSSIEEIMGFEGSGRVEYYSAFNSIISNKDFNFVRRSKRPPEDALNALISFGNSLMYNTVLSEIYRTHLNPTIGYLHSTNQRSFSLNLDLAELFKPIVVDRIIFNVLNKKILTINDFDSEMGCVLLNEGGRKKFVKEYDKKLATVIKYNDIHTEASYKRIIRLQAYALQKHMLEGDDLNFYWSRR